MNRGRNHENIFHDKRYFDEFLKCLKEASEQFDAVIHAYCLMTNHYHLLIEKINIDTHSLKAHSTNIQSLKKKALQRN